MARRVAVAVLVTVVFGACTDRLPEQDLRILSTAPVERLSAAVLWDDYAKDSVGAGRRYGGRAIVVTGQQPELGSDIPGQRFVRFVVADKKAVVRASLLDEQSASILAAAKDAPRVTLKCFCQGLIGTEIVLKSCVVP